MKRLLLLLSLFFGFGLVCAEPEANSLIQIHTISLNRSFGESLEGCQKFKQPYVGLEDDGCQIMVVVGFPYDYSIFYDGGVGRPTGEKYFTYRIPLEKFQGTKFALGFGDFVDVIGAEDIARNFFEEEPWDLKGVALLARLHVWNDKNVLSQRGLHIFKIETPQFSNLEKARRYFWSQKKKSFDPWLAHIKAQVFTGLKVGAALVPIALVGYGVYRAAQTERGQLWTDWLKEYKVPAKSIVMTHSQLLKKWIKPKTEFFTHWFQTKK
jgi:hypothetical protein